MLSANEIKLVRSLSEKKFRDKTGLFIAEGEKMTDEALRSGFTVKKLYRRDEIGEDTMKRISATSSGTPSLAVIHKPLDINIEDSSSCIDTSYSSGLFLALDSIRDPGNLGTILRIADWFGIDAVFASPDTCELYNPKTVQASMGSIFRKTFIKRNLSDTCAEFRAAGMEIYGTYLDGEDVRTAPLTDNGLIIMGFESDGISSGITSQVTRRLLIPPFPKNSRPTDSLNVATAAAVVCYEFRNR